MHPPQIPLTPQTDERNFPRWENRAPPGRSGHAYPKMLTRKFTKEDREEWREKHKRQDTNGRDYWEERCPKVGDPVPMAVTIELIDEGYGNVIGEDIVVANEDEEQAVLQILGINAPEPEPVATTVPLVPIARRTTADLEAENAALRRSLAARSKPAPKRRAKAKRKAPARAVTLDEMADDASEE